MNNHGGSTHNPTFLYDIDSADAPWTWAAQTEWQSLCKHGNSQSPLALDPEATKE